MIQSLPGENPDYTKKRGALLEAEIELKEARERVAALRRGLPLDNVCADYTFAEIPGPLDGPDGDPAAIRLSELFEDPTQPLVLMHFMFGKAQTSPCPMCSMWADGYNAAMQHLTTRCNFAVLIAGDPAAFRRFARSRGWQNLRVVSAADSTLKAELGLESEDGGQMPGVSVFTLGADGAPRHFYSASALLGNGHFRGMDLLSPVWNFFDLTPDGRGDWMPSLPE